MECVNTIKSLSIVIDLYCLPQTVESDPALTQESQEAVKQHTFANTSERVDKMNRNQVRAMFLLEI